MSFVIQRVAGRQISLSEIRTKVLRIGRGTNAELRSDNPAVALEHAVIEGDSAGYTITDRGSITGTYVNGKPVEVARLGKGDVIEIGDLRIDVQVADAAKPLFLRIVTKAKRNVSQAAPVIEDEEPVVVATPGTGAPVRSPRIDYAAAYRLTRPWLTKLNLIAIGLVITLAVVAEVTRPERQTVFMPGRVSSAHVRAKDAQGNAIANDCAACHDPWNSVSDARCVNCHRRVVHSETETGTPGCMQCHNEHRGLPKLALVNNATCTSCHADLPAHMKAGVTGQNPRYPIAMIKRITAFGVDHPELASPGDPNTIRFNHKLHLKKGGVFNASGKRQELTCDSCHKLSVVRGKADPLIMSFEQQCRSCHQLTFDARFPKDEVPHGSDPQLTYGYITTTFTGNRDIVGKSPDEVRRLLNRRAVVNPGDQAYFRAEQVVKTKCGKCHELQRRGQLYAVQKPLTRTTWFAGVKYTHTGTPHQANCESCHKGLRESAATSEAHMPNRDACAGCHGPTAAASASNCVTCHEYHVRSKPLLAGAAIPSGGTSPGMGGERRMIDTILLIAITLLLLVVFISVGIAVYQRLKPRPDDRVMPQQQRPAPPAPAEQVAPTRPVTLPPVAPAGSAAAAPPPPPPPPLSDATRMEMLPKGGGGSTEFVQWNGMLLCTAGPLEGQRFVVEEGGFYIGRDSQMSQVVINDSRISKRHVRILPRDGKVFAIDEGSTNGTFIGSPATPRISEVQLKRGDTLVLADNAASFVYQI